MDESPYLTCQASSRSISVQLRVVVSRNPVQSFSVAVGVHNYTVAVASWFAGKIQYVCFNSYIAIRNALLKLLIDAHMKMSMCTYAV